MLGGKPKGGEKDPAYNKVVTETVHYQGAGQATPADKKQSFTFTATVTYDKVTGEVLHVIWDKAKQSHAIQSPAVQGFKVSDKVVSSQKFTEKSTDKVVTVTYTANPTPRTKGILPSTGEVKTLGLVLLGIASLITAFILVLKKWKKG
jgi:LPXTG-motif cell wall-anchored protein